MCARRLDSRIWRQPLAECPVATDGWLFGKLRSRVTLRPGVLFACPVRVHAHRHSATKRAEKQKSNRNLIISKTKNQYTVLVKRKVDKKLQEILLALIIALNGLELKCEHIKCRYAFIGM